MAIEKNKLGGIEDKSFSALKRAQHADLVTLPKDISGTSCWNCKFLGEKENQPKLGDYALCKHPKVKQDVNARMCCAFWDNKGATRAFGKKQMI